MTNQFLALYPAKIAEYLLAVTYLVSFVAFWRYVQGGAPAPAEEPVRAPARRPGLAALRPQSWFTVPEGVWLHPGHTWARPAADGLVEVGLDEFAARLLGPVERISLPRPGAPLEQGAALLTAEEGAKQVSLVSPIDGEVVAVNHEAIPGARWMHRPYDEGWLLKVSPVRLAANARQLLAGPSAQRWLDEAGASLAARLAPEAGLLLQDGGAPVQGIARELEPEEWDSLCREYFRT